MAQDDDDKLPPLGEDTEKFLEDAKKGKTRSFLLICKGAKVRYLALRKKPVKQSEVVDAKKQGHKGDAYFGILTGKGMELVFNLLKSEYDAEPVKDKALKDFLEEQAQFKCKPTIQLVDVLPEIPLDEDDLKHPLVARFMSMDVSIVQLLDQRPEVAPEITQRVTAIRQLLQEAAFDAATPLVDQLEARIKELLANDGTNVQEPSPENGSAPTQAATLQSEYESKLAELQPLYEQVLRDSLGDTGKMRAVMAFTTEKAEVGDFATAIKALDRLKPLIDQAISGGSSPENLGIASGIVAKRKFLIERFQQIPLELEPQLNALRNEIEAQVEDEDPDDLRDAIAEAIEEFCLQVRDEIDAGIVSGNMQVVSGLRQRVLANELIQHLLNNPLVPGKEFEKVFTAALDEIEQHMVA